MTDNLRNMVPWILVAEDDPLSRRLLVKTLRARGYEVVDVEDGERRAGVAGASLRTHLEGR